jgi:high-affinity iron transporter
LGLVTLGFASVYREGFETVLFVQALVLEAGTLPVLAGVAVGAAATAVVGVLTITLQQKLPHKKMLIGSGLLIVWVLVVMVGTTVQALQVAGWVPVTPVDELRLPYWVGLWFGVYPTWEGLTAQLLAATFVLGSYVAAEQLRKRRRRVILARA